MVSGGSMGVLQARALGMWAALVLAFVAIACGSSNATSTSGQAARPTVSGLPPELADAVRQDDGTYLTSDGRVFAAPDEFSSEDCGDVRWAVADDTADHALDAGVPVDAVEWLTHHIHAYMGVFVDGEPEVVPAGIGIDNGEHRIAGLHTHDCTGTVHIEAEQEVDLTLGQFADTWGVRLDEECFDDLCGPESPVEVRHNGEPVADHRDVVISDCDEIIIVIGDPPDDIPAVRAEGC
jgi:hypothetical protein